MGKNWVKIMVLVITCTMSWAATSKPEATSLSLPLAFEPNRGQSDAKSEFVAQGNGYAISLSSDHTTLKLAGNVSAKTVQIRWLAANPAPTIQPEQPLAGRVNYLKGNDRSKWLTDVPTFKQVRMSAIYPGIDLVLYGNQGNLEYDWVVSPGADYKKVLLAFDGIDDLRLDGSGDLKLKVGAGEINQRRPVVYQWVGGLKRKIAGRYILTGNTVRFALGIYDPALPLIIDPTLSYSTFLGGSYYDSGKSVAVDGSGHAYVLGTTWYGFPTKNPYQGNQPERDAFITKFSADGKSLIYSTYLGGNGVDEGARIAIDSSGYAYLAGETTSTNFPVTAGAPQPTGGDVANGHRDAFLTKLSPTGNAIAYSTYLGGSNQDTISGMAIDSSHRMYVTGCTNSVDFPTKNAYQTALTSGSSGRYQNCNAFVTRLNATGTAWDYSTYLGGSVADQGTGIAVDSAGEAYVTGSTFSPDFPTTAGAYDRTLNGTEDDAFVTKFTADGTNLVFSTFLGGSGSDAGEAITLDFSGRIYIAGDTGSFDFPTTIGAFRRTNAGAQDVFVTRMRADGSALDWSTYLGGGGNDSVTSIVINSLGQPTIAGQTFSPNFPLKNALQATLRGNTDAFIAKLWATGGGLHYSTYFGGTSDDGANEVRVDGSGNAYVTGFTSSSDFPLTSGSFDHTFSAPFDAFVIKIAP